MGKNGILGYEQILNQLTCAKKLIEENCPDRILTIGGDCSVELAPISYLNKRYNSKLLIVWFDAHGDLNTPDSSPSQRFHGMPLRSLLGEGDHRFRHNFSPASNGVDKLLKSGIF